MSETMVWFAGATFALGCIAIVLGWAMWRASLKHLDEATAYYQKTMAEMRERYPLPPESDE